MNSKKSWGVLALVLLALPLLLFLKWNRAEPSDLSRSGQPSLDSPEGLPARELTKVFDEQEPTSSVPSTGADRQPVTPDASSEPALSAQESISPTLEVRVLFHDGEIATSGVVAVTTEQTVLSWERLTEAGSVLFERSEESRYVVVFGCSPGAITQRIKDDSGTLDVILPDEHEFSGRVLVNGAPLGEPLNLGVSQIDQSGSSYPYWLSVPKDMEAELHAEFDGSKTSLPVSATGVFRSTGWRERGRLLVQLPTGLAFADSGHRMQALDGPLPDAEFRLTAEPLLHGVVLSAETGLPVVEAAVELKKGRWGKSAGVTDQAGAFTLALRGERPDPSGRGKPSTLMEATLSIRSADLTQALESEVTFHPTHGGYLGTFALVPASVLKLKVVDVDQEPIVDAAIEFPGVFKKFKTDESGEFSRAGLVAGPVKFDVFAFSHRTRGIELPAVPSEPFLIVLDRCPTLEVEIVCLEGKPTSGFVLECRTSGALFQREEESVLDEGLISAAHKRISVGASLLEMQGHTHFSQSPKKSRFRVENERPVRLANVTPGQEIELRVLDSTGFTVWPAGEGVSTISLQAEEQRKIQIKIPCPAGKIRGRVENAHGEPLESIDVHYTLSEDRPEFPVSGNRPYFHSVRTESDGSFEIDRLAAFAVDLLIIDQRYAQTLKSGVIVGEEVTFTLQPGRRLRVRALDPAGRTVSVYRVDLYSKGIRIGDQSRESDGSLLCEDLPNEPLLLRARIGGGVHDAEISPDQVDVTFQVPACGQVEVEWKLRSPPDGQYFGVVVHSKQERTSVGRGRPISGLPDELTGTWIFDPVLPGPYTARLYELRPDESGIVRQVDRIVSEEFEVVAGETSKVELME